MSERYDGPRGCRGYALGNLLAWLVGAVTLAGLAAVLLSDPRAPNPGTAAEVAARTAPVGRLTLAEPPPVPAAQPAPGPVSPAVQTRTESQPETEPPDVEGPGAPGEVNTVVPTPEAPNLQTEAAPPEALPPSGDEREPGGAPLDGPPAKEGVGAAVGATLPDPSPAGDHQAPTAVASPPIAPPPNHRDGPYLMVPVPRPDLPGQPYQLVPQPHPGP
jgi:hypothetical protein